MTDVLLVADSEALRNEVKAAVVDATTTVREVTRGDEVRAAVADRTPDLVVLDLQVGKMGGMATCIDLHLEAGAGRLPAVPVLMLLDRRADVFLARRSAADGWVVKPLDPLRLARAVRELLGGGRYEDRSYAPVTVTPGPSGEALG
ncbi:MAG: response regulator transcription factor [Acidimicrobiales bacterium]